MRYLLLLCSVACAVAATFHLEHSKDGFGVRSHGIVEMLPSGRTKFYPLPQSTFDDYRRLRGEDMKINPVTASSYERQEVIGTSQTEGDLIWIGNSFYDGEGERGVGAFGYFDTGTRKYTLFSPPEIARWEISAMLVQPGAVWLGLDHFGEDISTFPGGLARFDRQTHQTHVYSLEFVVQKITAEGDSLRLKSMYGYAIFHDGDMQRFLSSGRQVQKFPPPPTHY